MKVAYDKYYETKNLFGNPYPELIDFFANYSARGTLLDLGCGQGRDAIPLAKLGYEVTGIDISKIGIEQMNIIAQREQLQLKGIVTDIFQFDRFSKFDFILLDSMFHFTKKDKKKETNFIKSIIQQVKKEVLITFCIPNTGNKVKILNDTIDFERKMERIKDINSQYVYEDHQTGHKSKTDYKIIIVKK